MPGHCVGTTFGWPGDAWALRGDHRRVARSCLRTMWGPPSGGPVQVARQVLTVSSKYAAPEANRRFGAQAASSGGRAPPAPSAAKMLITVQ